MRKRAFFCTTLVLVLLALIVAAPLVLLIRRPHRGKPVEMTVTASAPSTRIPDTLFGVFFEEINHAGVGGLWSELVMNRGFEAGRGHSPPHIKPWKVVGHNVTVRPELTSCFESNKVALRMDVLADSDGGVGVSNPGFGGMNIEKGKAYRVRLYARSLGPFELYVSFRDRTRVLGSTYMMADFSQAQNWTKMEGVLEANATSRNASLVIKTENEGTIWLDQVSCMPVDTHMGHGFRKDLMQMLLRLKPQFLRFPGGCFVEGDYLKNAFQWKKTIGPWEERSGHLGDIWGYWTDDGLGYLEFLQLAEDLDARPVWVINAGLAHKEQLNGSLVDPYVQDLLDSLEFARGDANSEWGSLRAKYGHPRPFDLKYVAVGNENCFSNFTWYQDNYLKFYEAIKAKYSDIQVINNCDRTKQDLHVPADLFDFHTYTDAEHMFSSAHIFDNLPRDGPKAFVSEYAVRDDPNVKGTLLGALGEAAFLIGLERNSDVVSMASYAPLFMHANDPGWQPNVINFDSWQAFGIPSYWMQTLFVDSSGATLLDVNHTKDDYLIASAITYKSSRHGNKCIKVKAVNFQNSFIDVAVTFKAMDLKSAKIVRETFLTSDNPYDLNSFENPTKVIPKSNWLPMHGNVLKATLRPYSLTSFDLCTSVKLNTS